MVEGWDDKGCEERTGELEAEEGNALNVKVNEMGNKEQEMGVS